MRVLTSFSCFPPATNYPRNRQTQRSNPLLYARDTPFIVTIIDYPHRHSPRAKTPIC